MGRRATILTSLAMVAVSSCGSPPAANPPAQPPVSLQSPAASAQPAKPVGAQTVELDVLAEGNQSQLHQPGFQVIRSARELTSFIQQAGLKDVDSNVDWKDQMVLAVYAGDRPGNLDITSMTIKDDILTAKVAFEAAAAAAAGPKNAYMLVVVPKAIEDVDVRGLPTAAAAQPTASSSPSASPSPAASPTPAASPSAAPSAATGQGNVSIIAQGAVSGVHQPVNVIIRTSEEWNAVWGTHAQGVQGQAQPTVDLDKQSVIGIFLGDQANAGGIAIDSIQQTQTGILLKAHVLPATQAQGQGKPSPFILIATPKLPAIQVDIQVQGGPQAPTLGNPQQPGQGQQQQPAQRPGYGQQPAGGTYRPGFGQPVQGGPQPGFGQPVGGSQLGGMPGGPNLGGANAQPPFPGRGSILTGGTGGLLGPGGYQ